MSEVLGLLFAVIVGLSFVPKLSVFSQKASDNTRAVTTAEQQKKLMDASTAYIQQYSSNLQSVATATNPAIITVAMLQSVKLLDGSFSPTNPYGQTWQTGVLQPSAGNLQALAMSYGGTALNDVVASKIAGLVGAKGGFIPKNDSGIYPAGAGAAYGSYSGWTIPTANYTSVSGGRLAALLTFSSGQLTSNYLYRNAVPGQPQLNKMGTAIDMGGNNVDNAGTVNATTVSATGNVAAGNRVTAGEYVQIKGTVVEGSACPSNDLVARDASGLILSCQSGSWKKAVKTPNSYRFMFTSSQSWTVPAGVSSAFVTMAGGGGSGAGWRVISTTHTGPSGGYVFSQPVNLVAGETMSVVVGQGGVGFSPVVGGTVTSGPYVGTPFYIAPSGDDGLGGYPGSSSRLVSPSRGVLLECAGGSGATYVNLDNYSGGKVAGNLDGANTGSGIGTISAPNRVAAGNYTTPGGPGACGPDQYGIGNSGDASWQVISGNRSGGKTPFGYGSGGDISITGCYVTENSTGTCIWAGYGRNGVVFIDVLY